MSIVSLLIGIAILIVLSYRGVKTFLSTLISCVVVLLLNGMNVLQGITEIYVGGFARFLSGFLFVMTVGALFGRLMSASGFARAFALKLLDVFGEKRVVSVIIIATSLFCIVGINIFIVMFAVYPIAAVIGERQNISKGVLASAIWCCGFTVGFPGSISVNNMVCSAYLGTNMASGFWVGIAGSLVTLAIAVCYTMRVWKKSTLAGEGFVPGPQDHIYLASGLADEDLPGWIPAFAVLLVMGGLGVTLSQFYDSVFAVITALLVSCLLVIILDFKKLRKGLAGLIGEGLMEGFTPLLPICALVGFGAVIQSTPGFNQIVQAVLELNINPYLATFLSTNALVGVTGSASGGLTIFLETMAQPLLETGIDPGAFHRIAAMSACGLDSLPHSAGIIGQLAVIQLTVRQGYKHAFFTTVIATAAGALVTTLLSLMFF